MWISTYTRALQRQIERESHAVYPDPAVRAVKAVVRKGRENYVCLLNYQDALNASRLGGGDFVGLALAARWIAAARDGDMTGGDFPAWLPTLFNVSPQAQASAANLVDRRGECIHAGCPHYRVCFIEKAVRGSRRADLVIANHALVLTQAALDGARAARGQAGTARRLACAGSCSTRATICSTRRTMPSRPRSRARSPPRCVAGSEGRKAGAGVVVGSRPD